MKQAVLREIIQQKSRLPDWDVHWAPLGMSLRICISCSPADTCLAVLLLLGAETAAFSVFLRWLILLSELEEDKGLADFWVFFFFFFFLMNAACARRKRVPTTGFLSSYHYHWEKRVFILLPLTTFFAASIIKWDHIFAFVISRQRTRIQKGWVAWLGPPKKSVTENMKQNMMQIL